MLWYWASEGKGTVQDGVRNVTALTKFQPDSPNIESPNIGSHGNNENTDNRLERTRPRIDNANNITSNSSSSIESFSKNRSSSGYRCSPAIVRYNTNSFNAPHKGFQIIASDVSQRCTTMTTMFIINRQLWTTFFNTNKADSAYIARCQSWYASCSNWGHRFSTKDARIKKHLKHAHPRSSVWLTAGQLCCYTLCSTACCKNLHSKVKRTQSFGFSDRLPDDVVSNLNKAAHPLHFLCRELASSPSGGIQFAWEDGCNRKIKESHFCGRPDYTQSTYIWTMVQTIWRQSLAGWIIASRTGLVLHRPDYRM